MKVRLVSMRKYKMRLPVLYRLKNLITFKKYWSGKIWSVMFMCEYGFDIDFRKGSLIDNMLNENEKPSFWMRINLLGRKS